MRVITRIVYISILTSLCTSCGGGGGGGNGSTVPPPPPPPANQAPTVDAGADQSVDEETSVNLSATGADSDGTIVSYSWVQANGPEVTLTNADAADMSFTAPAHTQASECPDELSFRVTVTDDDGATGSDTVSVLVSDTNPLPSTPSSAGFVALGAGNIAYDVSADGSVVVGGGCGAWGSGGFRWTSAGGMVELGELPGGRVGQGDAASVSDDGNVVVGTSWSESGLEAFRWTSGGGTVGLGDLPGGQFQSEAFGVSGDGSVVVGRSEATEGLEAFRWTAASGMEGLGDLPGGGFGSGARAASIDGSVVVGYGNVDGMSGKEAFRWTMGTGMVSLGQLPGAAINSEAHDVSADGSVIVGNGGSNLEAEAFLWTSAGGMMGLGYLPGFDDESRAFGVSADGTVVVGETRGGAGAMIAFVWTQADGMQSLRDVLIANGVTGLDNWELSMASGISADGEWVTGWGTNPAGIEEGFLANISAP
jgi:probable HAF family extracellular repeat protein